MIAAVAARTLQFSDLAVSVSREQPLFSRLVDHLTAVRILLERTSVNPILGEYFGDQGSIAQLLEGLTGDIHIGFLLPGETPRDVLVAAANHVGFSFAHEFFPSTIVAEELATLSGGRPVPTTLFKASLPPGFAGARALEAFLPDYDPSVVDGWIRDGVAAHIGLGVTDVGVLAHALEICKSQGYRLPAFLRDRPGKNVLEGVTSFYTDGTGPTGRFRLEFYHRAPSVAASIALRTSLA